MENQQRTEQVEINHLLLVKAEQLARERGQTVAEFVEDALKPFIECHDVHSAPHYLPNEVRKTRYNLGYYRLFGNDGKDHFADYVEAMKPYKALTTPPNTGPIDPKWRI